MVEYFKIPRQVEVEICVYFKKLYLREKCIKVKYTSTWINLIDIFFTRLCPLYLMFNSMHIMHTNVTFEDCLCGSGGLIDSCSD